MDASKIAMIAATGISLTGFAAARAAHQTTPPGEQQDVPGRSVGRAAAVAMAAVPLGLAYMYPFTNGEGGVKQRAIMVAAGGIQFAVTAGIVNYMNHNGSNDGKWNNTTTSMLISGATGALFGAAGALLAKRGGVEAAKWGAMGFIGGMPDGGWLQLFNRPGHNGFSDFGSWLRGDVPR